MDLKALRRQVARTQVATALAVPVVYASAMAAGALLYLPDLVLLVVVLDVLILLQARSQARAASVGPERPDGPELPARTVDEADACFLRFLRADALSQAAGLFVFLVALDRLARIRIAGGNSPELLLGGVAGAFALMAIGRLAARSTAWRDFAALHGDVWRGAGGLGGWRAAASAPRYLEWRASVRVHAQDRL